MTFVFLGTGTSVGVPMIGCDCRVCRSDDPRNYRRRTSLYLCAGGVHVVVDTAPDFREQMLTFRVPRIDAVLYTHSHADHVFGLDDIRRFNTVQRQTIPAYGSPETLADLRRIFNYIAATPTPSVYRPLIEFMPLEAPITLGELRISPVDVQHAGIRTYGFRFDADGRSLGYAPDCGGMNEQAVAAFRNVDVMALDTLRHHPHRTHLTVAQSLALLRRIAPQRAYTIHMCHDIEHSELEAALPAGVSVSYDGLRVEL